MNRHERDKDLNDLISDSRILLGDVEEMDKHELLAVLDDSDPPAEAVRHAMFLRIETLVRDPHRKYHTIQARWLSRRRNG